MKHLICVGILLMICLYNVPHDTQTVVATATTTSESVQTVTPEPVQTVTPNTIEPVHIELPLSYGIEIQTIIQEVSADYNIDATLLLAMAEVESSGNPKCVSKTDDYGLMQINKCNHEWIGEELGITDWLDAAQSVKAACFYLEHLKEQYPECAENDSCLLMCYNMGYGNATKLWNQGIYSSKYSRKILNKQTEIENILNGRGK